MTGAKRVWARGPAAAGAMAETTASTPPHESALTRARRLLRERWLRVTTVSGLLLVPCFWHHQIEADDLGSHLYNAWLVELIHQRQLPGLSVVHPWTNVLFDYMLSGLGAMFGLYTGEKIAVSLAVLIFFWGTFAMIAAAAGRAPWMLAPSLALVAYGWTFEMGLFNYYLSLGLAFFAFAFFWRGRGWERLLAVALAPLVLLADPLGLIWLAGACLYVGMAEAAAHRFQLLWFALAAAAILTVPKFLGLFYTLDQPAKPFYFFNGADQLVLFGRRYDIVEYALIAFFLVALAADVALRRRDMGLWRRYAIPAEFYALALLSVYVLPEAIHLSPTVAPAALLTERFTTISAALACCVLGAMRPRKWHLLATAAIAALFFAFLYQDTGRANNIEQQAVELVSQLPPNQRVLGSIFAPHRSRVLVQHLLDRACIGRCFSYGNYEPGSRDFRVRARPGNPYVLADYVLAVSTEEGTYVIQPRDLPVYQVSECGRGGTKLCIARLHAGEENNAVASAPPAR